MIQLWTFRIGLQPLLIFGDGLLDFSLAQQNISEIAVGQKILRVDFQRRRKMGERLIRFALGKQSVSEIIVRHGVAGGHLQSVLEETDAVFPKANLEGAHAQAANNGHAADQTEPDLIDSPAFCQVCRAPGEHDQQSNHGHIHITVSHRLLADLH